MSRAAEQPAGTRPGLLVARVEGAARRAGLRAGDRLVAVAGRRPTDVLDLEMAAADGRVAVVVERAGRRVRCKVVLERGEGHGIALEDGLGTPVRRCRHRCRFCFVDQLPRGLRPSLYMKDDDYRLSFLFGNFTTLGNLDESDMRRIVDLRLSPLYVSLHVWDDERRVRLMGPAARVVRRRVEQLASAGIELHVQVVLCPGWNDGAALKETVRRLAALEAVADVGVVPVSLAREGELRRVGPAEAEETLALIGDLQGALRPAKRRAFVEAADELYLLTERRPPVSDAPLQYENGIGIAASFLDEAAEVGSTALERAATGAAPHPPAALLSGRLAAPLVEEACRRVGGRCRPFVVENRLFGPHVTVTGLLGGADVLRTLRERPLAGDEWLLAPRAFLPADPGRTLDDVAVEKLQAACQGRFVVADGLREALAATGRASSSLC